MRVVDLCALARGGWGSNQRSQLKGFEPAARWSWAAFFFGPLRHGVTEGTKKDKRQSAHLKVAATMAGTQTENNGGIVELLAGWRASNSSYFKEE